MMQNIESNKNILVVENEMVDYEDIEPCLTEYEPDHWETLNNIDFENISTKYFLCICDILDYKVPTLDEYRKIEAFGSFRRGIKNISKLYQKNNGNFLIITKMPVNYLVEYFKLLDDDKDVNILFPDHSKLISDLENRASCSFGFHKQGNIVFITKPSHDDVINKRKWHKDFKELVNGIINQPKILVIEDEKVDSENIISCIPKSIQYDCVCALNEENIDFLTENYSLIISDFLEIDKSKTVDYNHDDVFNLFIIRIKKISELRKKYRCPLIISTKIPTQELRLYFDRCKSTSEMRVLFPKENEMEELSIQLGNNTNSNFLLYSSNEIWIVAKPYEVYEQTGSKIKDDISQWCHEIEELICHLLEQQPDKL